MKKKNYKDVKKELEQEYLNNEYEYHDGSDCMVCINSRIEYYKKRGEYERN